MGAGLGLCGPGVKGDGGAGRTENSCGGCSILNRRAGSGFRIWPRGKIPRIFDLMNRAQVAGRGACFHSQFRRRAKQGSPLDRIKRA
jgi:hypothetical protein